MLILFLLCLLGSFSLTIISHALRSFKKGRLDVLFKEIGNLLFFPKAEIHKLFLTALSAKYLLVFTAAVAATFYVIQETTLPFAILFLILALFLTLIIGDFLPKILVGLKPKRALKIFTPIASCFLWLTAPFTFIFSRLPSSISNALSFEGIASSSLHVNDEIIQMLEDPKVKASLDPHNKKLITAVLNFKDRIVREVMIPRVSVFSLANTHTIKSATEILLSEGYSRVPVYKDSIDTIIGILMYKDIFNYTIKHPNALDHSIESLLKPVFYTPETKRVSHLLQEFRNKQMHFAVVVDEYGGTEGIVTIEDILEEIVGDISDEYDDAKEVLYKKGPEGGWIIDAKMPILEIEENFGIIIPQDADYDTLGGYIYHKAGAIPKKGFHIYHDAFELEVLSSTDRSVGQVRITPRVK